MLCQSRIGKSSGLERISDFRIARRNARYSRAKLCCLRIRRSTRPPLSRERIKIQSRCIRYVRTNGRVWYNGSRPLCRFMVESDELRDGVVQLCRVIVFAKEKFDSFKIMIDLRIRWFG